MVFEDRYASLHIMIHVEVVWVVGGTNIQEGLIIVCSFDLIINISYIDELLNYKD